MTARTLFPVQINKRYADAALAAVVVLIVGMMIVPLPTPLLDVLLASNISFAVLILLVSIYVADGLSFASFPTLLLVTTLYRLALNVSSTRLILLQGDAGRVIEAFGHFVIRGNYVVGAVVFLILTLIQFLVIAKGAERVAEVGARFTLDAMPGKQMSIDAELRTGALTQEDAKRRRRLLQRESQFYGAMDGAMKFVKGDAIAGIIIIVINILGGVAIGVGMRGMDVVMSLKKYGLLTIGDGLVSQIPALLISTAAGLVVTRVASEEENASLANEVSRQVFGNPKALAVAAVFMGLLAIVPGLPAIPFLVLGCLLGVVAYDLRRKLAGASLLTSQSLRGDVETNQPTTVFPPIAPLKIDVGRELGAILVPPGDSGPFQQQFLAKVRTDIFTRSGIMMPAVRVQVSPTLPPRAYSISVHEIPAGQAQIPHEHMSVAPSEVAEHIEKLVERHASSFVGLQETQTMIEQVERTYPALVRNAIPKPVALPLLTDILKRLAEEGVSIRPMREILETLAIYAANERDPITLTELVRASLRAHICSRFTRENALSALLVDHAIEDAIRHSIQRSATGTYLAMPPAQAKEVIQAVRATYSPDRRSSAPPVIALTQADVRRFFRKLIENDVPDLAVLSYNEIPADVTVQPVGHIRVGSQRP